MRRKLKIALFVALLVTLGFAREAFFTNINGALYNKFYNPGILDKHTIHRVFEFLNWFSYDTLYIAKWIITPFAVLLFWFVQRKFLWTLFEEKKSLRWLSVLYLSLLLLAVISYFTGWLVGFSATGYRFSRIFMGVLESPAPGMILIPLTYFYKNFKT